MLPWDTRGYSELRKSSGFIACCALRLRVLLGCPVPALRPRLTLGKKPWRMCPWSAESLTPGLAAPRSGLGLGRGHAKMHFSDLLLELLYKRPKAVTPQAPVRTASLEGSAGIWWERSCPSRDSCNNNKGSKGWVWQTQLVYNKCSFLSVAVCQGTEQSVH